jgi:hypothetical protein
MVCLSLADYYIFMYTHYHQKLMKSVGSHGNLQSLWLWWRWWGSDTFCKLLSKFYDCTHCHVNLQIVCYGDFCAVYVLDSSWNILHLCFSCRWCSYGLQVIHREPNSLAILLNRFIPPLMTWMAPLLRKCSTSSTVYTRGAWLLQVKQQHIQVSFFQQLQYQ